MALCGVMRVEKRKINAVSGLEAEANRNKKDQGRFPNSDIDWQKTSENLHLVQTEGWREEIKRQVKDTGVKVRSDSITLLDGLYTASPEFFEGKSQDEILKYFDQCLDFHIKHYCKGDDKRLINAVIHLDEKTPHLQVASIPIIYDKEKEKYRLTAKEIMGNRKAYQGRQDAFYNEVTKSWGLERGDVTKDPTRAKEHLHKRQWELEKAEKELQKVQKSIEKSNFEVKLLNKKLDEFLSFYTDSKRVKASHGLIEGERAFEVPGIKLGAIRIVSSKEEKNLQKGMLDKELDMHKEAYRISTLSTSVRQRLKELDNAYKVNSKALQEIKEETEALKDYDKNLKQSKELATQRKRLQKEIAEKEQELQEKVYELGKMQRYGVYKKFAEAHKDDFEKYVNREILKS